MKKTNGQVTRKANGMNGQVTRSAGATIMVSIIFVGGLALNVLKAITFVGGLAPKLLKATIFFVRLVGGAAVGGLGVLVCTIRFVEGIFTAILATFLVGYHFFGYVPEWKADDMAWFFFIVSFHCLAVLAIYKFFN